VGESQKVKRFSHSNDVSPLTQGSRYRAAGETTRVILGRISKFKRKGSNWYLRSVVKLEVHVVGYKPLKGQSYIKLPKALRDTRAIINLKNEKDNGCFKWAVRRTLNRKDQHPARIDRDLRERANEFNWSGIEFPVSLASISKFKK